MTNNDKIADKLEVPGMQERPVAERVALHVKEQNRIRRLINKSLEEGPKTVPAIAEATNLPSRMVFWHVIAMKKYGKVAEGSMEGDYPAYRLIEESKGGN